MGRSQVLVWALSHSHPVIAESSLLITPEHVTHTHTSTHTRCVFPLFLLHVCFCLYLSRVYDSDLHTWTIHSLASEHKRAAVAHTSLSCLVWYVWNMKLPSWHGCYQVFILIWIAGNYRKIILETMSYNDLFQDLNMTQMYCEREAEEEGKLEDSEWCQSDCVVMHPWECRAGSDLVMNLIGGWIRAVCQQLVNTWAALGADNSEATVWSTETEPSAVSHDYLFILMNIWFPGRHAKHVILNSEITTTNFILALIKNTAAVLCNSG